MTYKPKNILPTRLVVSVEPTQKQLAGMLAGERPAVTLDILVEFDPPKPNMETKTPVMGELNCVQRHLKLTADEALSIREQRSLILLAIANTFRNMATDQLLIDEEEEVGVDPHDC